MSLKKFEKIEKKSNITNFPIFFFIFFKKLIFPLQKIFFCSKKFHPPNKIFFQSLINKMQ